MILSGIPNYTQLFNLLPTLIVHHALKTRIKGRVILHTRYTFMASGNDHIRLSLVRPLAQFDIALHILGACSTGRLGLLP